MNHRPPRARSPCRSAPFLAFAGGVRSPTPPAADGDVVSPTIEGTRPLRPGRRRGPAVGHRRHRPDVHRHHPLDPGQTVSARMDSASAARWTARSCRSPMGPLGPSRPPVGRRTASSCTRAGSDRSQGGHAQRRDAPRADDAGQRLRVHDHVSPLDRAVRARPTAEPSASIDGLVDIVLDVVNIAPPALTASGRRRGGGAVEANTAGGWTADWAGLGATDAEDAPDPARELLPAAAGTVLALGTTSVTCSVTDSGGHDRNAPAST